MDPIAEIKKIYYAATKATIQGTRSRDRSVEDIAVGRGSRPVAVYMDGLCVVRMETGARGGGLALLGPDAARRRRASGTFRSVESFFASEELRRCIMFMLSAPASSSS
jgi:hypothetical protein